MANIQPYVRTLCMRNMPETLGLSSGYIRRGDVDLQITKLIMELLTAFNVSDRIDTVPRVDQLFIELLNNGCFQELSDDFAGSYYKVLPKQLEAVRRSLLSGDDINDRADAIGEERYFSDVFSAFSGGETEVSISSGLSISVPASDRIVSINHNLQLEIDAPLVALIDDVRSDNEFLDEGVKERLIGQLRAGHELVNSGSVRAYILYHTLVRGLMELVARYRGRTIAVAAEKLIELLIEHIFQGGS